MTEGVKASIRIQETLDAIGLPNAYFTFRGGKYIDEEGNEVAVVPPFVVYYGSGQAEAVADNTHYWSEDTYNIEYYFTEKSSTKEEEIEAAILNGGFQFEKSEDIYLEDEDVFVIYYYLS